MLRDGAGGIPTGSLTNAWDRGRAQLFAVADRATLATRGYFLVAPPVGVVDEGAERNHRAISVVKAADAESSARLVVPERCSRSCGACRGSQAACR